MDASLRPDTFVESSASVRQLRELPLPRPLRTLNVCGGHERTIAGAGLRPVLSGQFDLIPGPGCPVCICPEIDIAAAIYLAQQYNLTLAAFGDMLRVPIVSQDENFARSLAMARSGGADVRPIASPMEVISLAKSLAPKPVVFFAVGFETTMAPVAAMVCEGLPRNLYLLVAGRRTWPIVKHLLAGETTRIDALIAPGHVATIIGSNEWRDCAEEYGIPTAVAGFKPQHLLTALGAVASQFLHGYAALVNVYPEAVQESGNARARDVLARTFDVVPALWRGIGMIPDSGYELKSHLHRHDARRMFSIPPLALPRAGKMPAHCACAQVVLGKCLPTDCPSFGAACKPEHPLGPCMVSDEGACRIWWSSSARPRSSQHE